MFGPWLLRHMALRNLVNRGLAVATIDTKFSLPCFAACFRFKEGLVWGSHGFKSSQEHASGHPDDVDDAYESGRIVENL